MQNRRNNILAGLFVLLGVILSVWVSFLLSDRSAYASTHEFTVRFPIASGASGLKRGSSVMLGGQQIGRVLGVDFQRTPAGVPTSVDVRVEVRSDLTIYENAAVFLEKPLLGSLSSINIPNPGVAPEPSAPHAGASGSVEPGEVLLGRTAPPGFLADAGFGPEQASQLQNAIASLDSTIQKIEKIVDNGGPNVEAGVADARAMIADLRVKLGEWSARIDSTAANIDAASARLDPILTKVDESVEGAKGVIASLRSLVDDNRQRIDAIIANVESATGKFDQVTIESVNGALRDGRDALGVFSEAVARVSALVGEQTPNLRRTLANLRLMSDQLKLTAVEVRSQPWRLLHQPTTKELEVQVLYDATRSYAEATSDLRAASEALQAATAISAAGGKSTPDITLISQRLAEALEKYRQAERYLLDRLIQKEGTK